MKPRLRDIRVNFKRIGLVPSYGGGEITRFWTKRAATRAEFDPSMGPSPYAVRLPLVNVCLGWRTGRWNRLFWAQPGPKAWRWYSTAFREKQQNTRRAA